MKYSEAMYYCTRGCIVEPIVANRKKKHLYQWLLDPKTLLKTIFTNGYFQAILSLAMVILKTIDF